jgi:hypothetical protein
MLLCLYHLSVSRPVDANHMSNAAIAAATSLQLNLELEQSRDDASVAFPYDLARPAYAECRRRTFWSSFILERLNGQFPAATAIINAEDIFIRLPADVRSFEAQLEVATPAFEPNCSSIRHQRTGVGVMAYLVQIVSVWGDVMASIYRVSRRSKYYNFDFAEFHHHTMARLEDWKSSVPQRLLFSNANLEAVAPEDRGSLILMHLVYHLTAAKLHRHIYPRPLTASSREEYARSAREQAKRLLEVVCTIAMQSSSPGRSELPPPFTCYAILEAADIASAEGPMAELATLVDYLVLAKNVMEALGQAWEDARAHKFVVEQRVDRLIRLRERGPDAAASSLDMLVFTNGEGKGPYWQILEPLETRFPREMDCVYPSLHNRTPLT